MCGICGVVYADRDRPAPPALVQAMCQAQAHRGPDAQGVWTHGQAGLGSQRLSIIDLAGGQQPIHNETGTIWLVFNGEIYNCRQLTNLLEWRGHRFYTHSDTEVIIHAYEEFGDECPQHLNGMFAFALWDETRQRLLAARDRMGIKPLHYTQHDGALIFGSELKALLAYPGLPRRVDLASLDEYLSFEYVPTPRTIFQNIFKLPPGHALAFEGGAVRLWQYYDIGLERSEGVRPRPAASYLSELAEILRQAVQAEMMSDVPLGVLLSGGIDSSTVAALMTEAAPGRVQSFSVAFEDASFDESRYARLAARHLGTEHHELMLTSGALLDVAPRLGQYLDEPLGDSSFIPTFLLSQFTRQQVKVALGGDGGDEVFGGYSTLQAHRLADYYERWAPGLLRHWLAPGVAARLPVSFANISFDFKLRRFLSGQGEPSLVRHHQWLGSFTSEQKRGLLLTHAQLTEKEAYAPIYACRRACQAADLLNQVLYCDFKLYLEGDILPKVDRASMANSLEVRVPLLNHTVMEFASRLPHSFKLHGLTTKYLLRRVMAGRLPDEILRRGKKGFNMPVARWLNGPLRPLAEDLLSGARLKREGFFEPAYVRRLLDEHQTGRHDHRKLLWTLLVFELWYNQWMA